MRRNCVFILTGFLTALWATAAPAQKQSRPDVAGLRLVSGPKGDRPHVPGLNAVFMFTDEQKEQLSRAHRETVGGEAVVAAGKKVKGDPNATEADRQAARKLAEDAQAQYDRRLQEILTPAQRELVQRLNVILGQARETVSSQYATKLINSKGNKEETAKLREESRNAMNAEFLRLVNEILTPEQRAAFEKAAAEEQLRNGKKAGGAG